MPPTLQNTRAQRNAALARSSSSTRHVVNVRYWHKIKVRTRLAVVANRIFVNGEADLPKARYAAIGSASPDETRSKGSRILTVVPVGSCFDGTMAPPS